MTNKRLLLDVVTFALLTIGMILLIWLLSPSSGVTW